MSNSSHEELGTNILTGAVIFGTFLLLVALLASTGPRNAETSEVAKPAVETVVVVAPRTNAS